MTDALLKKTDWLFRPVHAASTGAFRVMFGVLMLVEVYRYFANGWIHQHYIAPNFQFKYLFFEWLHPWPGIGMYIHFSALGVLAVLIALGLFCRAAMVLFFLGFSYVFLLDQGRYLNHFYLICLVAFLMCFTDAHRWLSLDRRLSRRKEPAAIPFWQLFLLRAQLFVVYFYAGVAKLNPDWLNRGEPLRTWLFGPVDGPGAELLPRIGWMVYFIGWAALLFDLSIGFLLIWRRTRRWESCWRSSSIWETAISSRLASSLTSP